MREKRLHFASLLFACATLILLLSENKLKNHAPLARELEARIYQCEKRSQILNNHMLEIVKRFSVVPAKPLKDPDLAASDTLATVSEGSEGTQTFPNKIPKESIDNSKISLHLENVPISQAIISICLLGGQNVAIDQDVSGEVSLDLNDVPWEQALTDILSKNGLEKIQSDGVFWILTTERLNKLREQVIQHELAMEELKISPVKVIEPSSAAR